MDTQNVIIMLDGERIMETDYADAKRLISKVAFARNYGLCRTWNQIDAAGIRHEFWDAGLQTYELVFVKNS